MIVGEISDRSPTKQADFTFFYKFPSSTVNWPAGRYPVCRQKSKLKNKRLGFLFLIIYKCYYGITKLINDRIIYKITD